MQDFCLYMVYLEITVSYLHNFASFDIILPQYGGFYGQIRPVMAPGSSSLRFE